MQIASSAADRQWFNTAAPQMEMHMLIPIENNTEKENNLPVVTKDKKPEHFFPHNDIGLSQLDFWTECLKFCGFARNAESALLLVISIACHANRE